MPSLFNALLAGTTGYYFGWKRGLKEEASGVSPCQITFEKKQYRVPAHLCGYVKGAQRIIDSVVIPAKRKLEDVSMETAKLTPPSGKLVQRSQVTLTPRRRIAYEVIPDIEDMEVVSEEQIEPFYGASIIV